MLMLWATPHGFVKAARAHHATMTRVADGTEVSFTLGRQYKMTGIIDAQHHVARVQTWIDQSILGDMPVETEYSGYKDFGGVLFPSRIVQKQDGFPSLDLTVTSVMANPSADIVVPDDVRTATPPPVRVDAQKVAEGVFWLTGGTHHSMAIEMKDHIVLVDTPNGEARAGAVIGKAKHLLAGKPVRYVVAMHHHWDHLGGIRTSIDEGATIVTHETNKAFLERAAIAPHTLNPDRLALSTRPLKLQSVSAEATLTDGTRTIKLYLMTGFEHTADLLMVYLPKEKILVEADAYTPPETPTTPLIAPKVPYAAALLENIQRLKLDVQMIVPFHGARTVDVAEVARQAQQRIESSARLPACPTSPARAALAPRLRPGPSADQGRPDDFSLERASHSTFGAISAGAAESLTRRAGSGHRVHRLWVPEILSADFRKFWPVSMVSPLAA